jgi:hypothetical protein
MNAPKTINLGMNSTFEGNNATIQLVAASKVSKSPGGRSAT